MFQNNQARLKLELYYRDHAVLQSSYYHDLVNELQKDNFRAIKLLRHIHWNQDSRETFANGKFKTIRMLGLSGVESLAISGPDIRFSGACSINADIKCAPRFLPFHLSKCFKIKSLKGLI